MSRIWPLGNKWSFYPQEGEVPLQENLFLCFPQSQKALQVGRTVQCSAAPWKDPGHPAWKPVLPWNSTVKIHLDEPALKEYKTSNVSCLCFQGGTISVILRFIWCKNYVLFFPKPALPTCCRIPCTQCKGLKFRCPQLDSCLPCSNLHHKLWRWKETQHREITWNVQGQGQAKWS